MNYERYAIDKMQEYHSKLVGVRNLEEELAELREMCIRDKKSLLQSEKM